MAEHRTRKSKENPHYQFLYSWDQKAKFQARVKGESEAPENLLTHESQPSKKANVMAKDGQSTRIKKDIVRSLVLVSFVLALELVLYLARSSFIR